MIVRRFLLPLFSILMSCAPVLMAEETMDEQVKKTTLVQPGQVAPDFTCQTTDGRSISLAAQKGKVVLLYFFSSKAGVCVTQLRHLEEAIFKKLGGRDDFLMLAVGRGDEREALVKAGGANGLTFPLVPDPQAVVFGRYFGGFVPRCVVVRQDGTVAAVQSGYHEVAGIAELQEVLARELKAAAP